jgi:5-methylcytosine-specific restriction endonuclease McrA
MPCHPARARMLLREGEAAVLRRYPFTIILKDRVDGDCQPLEIKVDPGSKTTGIALVTDFKKGKTVVWAAELKHRGQQIKDALDTRRSIRRLRRSRKVRYRPARFNNRTRPEGWLAPSLMSRVHNADTWARRLLKCVPVTSIAIETVRFDTQKLVNPEISGIQYQQGDLYDYEVKEYLLEKWNRKCAYCGKTNIPLEVEHIVPRSRGGSSRVSNLTLSCESCNQKKGNLTADEFGYPDVQKQAQKPLKDVAAVNATRYAIGNTLKKCGLPVSFWSGGRTKYNRIKQGYQKAHWIDAACVGKTGESVRLNPNMCVFVVIAKGHGNRQMCGTDKYGFPIRHRSRQKTYAEFQTGDIITADIPSGKYKGSHSGSVAIRTSGYFDIKSICGKRIAQGISHRYFNMIHRFDGYNYYIKKECATSSPCMNAGASVA